LLLNAFVLILEFLLRIVDCIFFVYCAFVLTLINKYLSKISQKSIIKTNKKKRNRVKTKIKKKFNFDIL